MKGYRKMKFSHLSFKELSSKALTSLIVSAFLISSFLVYPFFMKSGYAGICDAKYEFFLYSCLITILLLLLTGIVPLINSFKKTLATDVFVFLFMAVSLISFLVSPYRQTSFIGSTGWNMGFLTWIVMIIMYYLISRLWDFSKYMLYAALAGSFGVFLLGILDRFSFYIIPLEIRNPSFISTIGNINWFMGYFSVMVPIGVTMWCAEKGTGEKKSRIKKALLGLYVLISFSAGFAQGGESVLLFDAALFAGLLFFVFKGKIELKNWFFTVALWGLGAQIIRVMRVIPGLEFNYETTGVCVRLSEGNLMLFVMLGALLAGAILHITGNSFEISCFTKIKFNNATISKIFCVFMFILMGCSVIFWLLIGFLKTNSNILPGFENSVFYFDIRFGSGRGLAFWAAFEGIKSFDFGRFLIGVGPDCFEQFVYSLPGVGETLQFYWPADRLTNAHSEMLTMMVNEGLLGLITYLGIFISFMISQLKAVFRQKNSEDSAIGMCVILAVFCYLIHNIISFSQICNTPFIFNILGIGGSLILNRSKEV